MFNSLLNASSASIDSLVLDVFIILAVVLAGGLIVYFLWEMVNKIVLNNKNSKSDDKLIFDEKDKKTASDGNLSAFSLDEQKDEQAEQQPVNAEPETQVEKQPVTEETEIVDVDENKAEEEKSQLEAQISEEERENAERRAYLEARRQEILRRMQENRESEEVEEQEESQTEEETQTEVEPVEQIEDPTETVETQETEAEQQEYESTSDEDALEEEKKKKRNTQQWLRNLRKQSVHWQNKNLKSQLLKQWL